MLGLIKSNQTPSWMWAAYGKHPVVKDYFRIGQDFPLLKVFAGWVENGYKALSRGREDIGQNVWHFWARGATGESIVCGLVKDSADGFGRRYPLLIFGAGPANDWEQHWDLLPLALEPVWRDIEQFLSREFSDLKQLEAEVNRLGHPQPLWPELKSRKDSSSRISDNFQNPAVFTADEKDSFIPLGQSLHPDQYALISQCHSLFRSSVGTIPNVVFMGESHGRFFVKFYTRPLTHGDFVGLWNAGREPGR